jgi:hypothetical protein
LQLSIKSGNIELVILSTANEKMVADTGYRPDGQWQDVWVEVKFETHSIRNLRASLLGLAYWLTNNPTSRGLLVLVDSRMTEERLQREWKLAEQTLHPEVLERMTVAFAKNKQYVGLPRDLGDNFRVWLDQLVLRESREGKPRESFYAILEVLLHQWLLGKGPMASQWLMKTVGCSYPTVATSLRRLEPSLLRHSDRRVELRYFPRDEWARLLAVSDEVRSATRFSDRSGQPRSIDSLVDRLKRLGRSDIAVGGVIGARHYQPALDLVGTPRLDLSLHCRGKNVDWNFVKELDPALQETKRRDEPAPLVIHLVRRARSLFEPGEDRLPWADPVECLLDLHEGRLESQALEFVQSFPAAKRQIP